MKVRAGVSRPHLQLKEDRTGVLLVIGRHTVFLRILKCSQANVKPSLDVRSLIHAIRDEEHVVKVHNCKVKKYTTKNPRC
jgi:hypothetical protein